MKRAAILVLGMHRSGTSALAWLLGRLGAALPNDAINASGDNARGYWESRALVKADDQLLRVARSSWFDPRALDLSRLSADGLNSRRARIGEAIEAAWGDAPLLAIKDPRQCRCVPLIADILRGMAIEPRAVLMLRSPAEIARSLESRDGTTPAYAHLLWLRHMMDAERATRGMLRAIVDYDGMLNDWRDTVAQLAPLAGREGWQPGESDAAEIEAFLDPGLRHHRASSANLDEPLLGIVRSVDAALRALLERDNEAARDSLDLAYATLDQSPSLEGDIVHDELRHRRMGAGTSPEPDEETAPDTIRQPAPAAPGRDDFDAAALIRNSGLFDRDYYLARYPDVTDTGLDPIEHYLRIGAAQGYHPSPLFDTGYYARQMARRIGVPGGGR